MRIYKTTRIRHADLQPRQILGVSLTPAVVQEVKAEAARRRLPVKAVFLEMWESYKKAKKPAQSKSAA